MSTVLCRTHLLRDDHDTPNGESLRDSLAIRNGLLDSVQLVVCLLTVSARWMESDWPSGLPQRVHLPHGITARLAWDRRACSTDAAVHGVRALASPVA